MFDVTDEADDHAHRDAAEAQCAALPEPLLRGLDEPNRAAERARYIAEVFAAHHRPLRSFLSRLLRNEDDIADTVQEVFLRIAQLPDPSRLDLNPRGTQWHPEFLLSPPERRLFEAFVQASRR